MVHIICVPSLLQTYCLKKELDVSNAIGRPRCLISLIRRKLKATNAGRMKNVAEPLCGVCRLTVAGGSQMYNLP